MRKLGNRRVIWLGLALALATFVLYWPVRHHEFVRIDDPAYVLDNPRVMTGLGWENIAWAFTTGHSSNWHPVTWLSHMLDAEMFGGAAGGHHLASVFFHAANAFLLCLVLARATGAAGLSLLVAALWAFHPLRVESVAWVSERKDVLSMFFFLLMLAAYMGYADGKAKGLRENSLRTDARSRWSYVLALGLFALGLMSKPMLVTAPFVLLLIDVWPLGRVKPPGTWRGWQPIAIEKLPFFGLAAASSIITYAVQEKAHAVTLALPLGSRVANAVASYWKYLWKTFWPFDLAVFYPHPDTRFPISDQWPAGMILLGGLGLLMISVLGLMKLRRSPWFAMGWFWFLGTLVPVIGLVQVGGQAMADRYTYLPHAGLLIAMVWTAASILSRWPATRLPSSGFAMLTCAALAISTRHQLAVWQNNRTLFEHALEVTRNNPVAHYQVGSELGKLGDYDKAIDHFQAALRAAPASAEARFGLGYTYELQGNFAQALENYELALKLRPWDDWYFTRAGVVLWGLGRAQEAVSRLRQAISLKEDAFEPQLWLGIVFSETGNPSAAEQHFRKALLEKPWNKEAIGRLAELFLKQGRPGEAEPLLGRLVQLEPENADFLINLGGVVWMRGARAEAFELYRRATLADPGHAMAQFNLGIAQLVLNRPQDAEQSFRKAIQLRPDYAEALTQLGKALMAQSKIEEAIAAYEKAVALRPSASALAAYDTALAESGDFGKALEWAEKAKATALKEGRTDAAEAADKRMELYRQKNVFRPSANK